MWPVTSSSMPAFSIEITASGPPLPSRSVKPSGRFEPCEPAATNSPSRAMEAEERRRAWLASFSVHTATEMSPLCANNKAPSPLWRVQCPRPFMPNSEDKDSGRMPERSSWISLARVSSAPNPGRSPAWSISIPVSMAMAPRTVV